MSRSLTTARAGFTNVGPCLIQMCGPIGLQCSVVVMESDARKTYGSGKNYFSNVWPQNCWGLVHLNSARSGPGYSSH